MDVRLCKKEDIPLLVAFLKEYWSPNHVLCKRPEVLFWQYKNDSGGLNFLMAINNGKLDAVLGFIPLSHFDQELASNNEAWGALWKVRPDCEIPGLGTYLQRIATRRFSFFGGIGVSDNNISIQRALKNTVVHINHYYVINPNILDYSIAVSPEQQFGDNSNVSINFTLEEIDNLAGVNEIKHAYYPQKTNRYIINKYQNNPFYRYRFLCCIRNGEAEAIVVIKVVEVKDRKACRVIDILGDLQYLKGLGNALKDYISKTTDIEYLDFYNSGISKNYFINNGFSILDDYDDRVIIPNYFEPFLKKNCPLDGIIISKNPDKYVFFKGDADQDRPNK